MSSSELTVQDVKMCLLAQLACDEWRRGWQYATSWQEEQKMKQELARAKAEVIPARGHRLLLGRARS